MESDEYHEAILDRIHAMQREIACLPQREALGYAYLVSRDIPEEAARMLVAELLLDYWSRINLARSTRRRASSGESAQDSSEPFSPKGGRDQTTEARGG